MAEQNEGLDQLRKEDVVRALNGGKANLTEEEEKVLRMRFGIGVSPDTQLEFPASGREADKTPTTLGRLTSVDVVEAGVVKKLIKSGYVRREEDGTLKPTS